VRAKTDGDPASTAFSGFYKTRRRVYGVLLLFILAAGLPISAIPKWRERLLSRTWAFKNAFTGKRSPAVIRVGQIQEPLPPEFQTPAAPTPTIPPLAKVHSTAQGGYIPGTHELRASSTSESRKKILSAAVREEEAAEESAPDSSIADNEPKYRQGGAEQQAYDLLMASIPMVADIVKGNNPSYRFRSWDAAARGDDLFWVRLKLQAEGQAEADYIWQVKLEAKKASPLNHNARSIH
jgi:hypothetical protein